MDTDDFTEMAWDVIVCAARVSDTLKAELGAMAYRFQSEDEWLHEVRAHLKEITEDTAEYVEFWNLENEEKVTAAIIGSFAVELRGQVKSIISFPKEIIMGFLLELH